MTRLVLPVMQEKRKGGIINLASVAGTMYLPLMSVYSATKVKCTQQYDIKSYLFMLDWVFATIFFFVYLSGLCHLLVGGVGDRSFALQHRRPLADTVLHLHGDDGLQRRDEPAQPDRAVAD